MSDSKLLKDRVSVITISLNPGESLHRTIQSLRAQDYENIEWIVVDGGSIDGSVELIRRHLRIGDEFLSEPDRGIGDAFNKGISLSSGDVVVFMNAGDAFVDASSISRVLATWQRSTYDWIITSTSVLRDTGEYLYTRSPVGRSPVSLVRHGCKILHAGVFLHRALFDEFGRFDHNIKIAMDYDLWIRLIINNVHPQLTHEISATFYLGGISSDPVKRVYEEKLVRRKNNFDIGRLAEFKLKFIAHAKKCLLPLNDSRVAYQLKEFFKL